MRKTMRMMLGLAAAAPLALGVAAPSAGAASVPDDQYVDTSIGKLRKGSVLTAEQERLLACYKWGYGGSTGYIQCDGYRFKVRVWCTWAGGGVSDVYRWNYNWARCNRGSVSSNADAIEMIVG